MKITSKPQTKWGYSVFALSQSESNWLVKRMKSIGMTQVVAKKIPGHAMIRVAGRGTMRQIREMIQENIGRKVPGQ